MAKHSTVLANEKQLLINPKEKHSNQEKVKDELMNKVNPASIRSGIVIDKQTKEGGVIVRCRNKAADIKDVQSRIQDNLGNKYEVLEKPLAKNRMKVTRINEHEYCRDDSELVSCILSQNEQNQ